MSAIDDGYNDLMTSRENIGCYLELDDVPFSVSIPCAETDMADKIKVKFYVQTSKKGSRVEDFIEFDRDEWESMEPKDQEQAVKAYIMEYVEWGWGVE